MAWLAKNEVQVIETKPNGAIPPLQKKGCAAMRGLSFFEGVETVPEGARGESRERFRAERRALCATQPEWAPPRRARRSVTARGLYTKDLWLGFG